MGTSERQALIEYKARKDPIMPRFADFWTSNDGHRAVASDSNTHPAETRCCVLCETGGVVTMVNDKGTLLVAQSTLLFLD